MENMNESRRVDSSTYHTDPAHQIGPSMGEGTFGRYSLREAGILPTDISHRERGPILLDIPNGRNELVLDGQKIREVPKLYPIIGLRKHTEGIALPPPVPLDLPEIKGENKAVKSTQGASATHMQPASAPGRQPASVKSAVADPSSSRRPLILWYSDIPQPGREDKHVVLAEPDKYVGRVQKMVPFAISETETVWASCNPFFVASKADEYPVGHEPKERSLLTEAWSVQCTSTLRKGVEYLTGQSEELPKVLQHINQHLFWKDFRSRNYLGGAGLTRSCSMVELNMLDRNKVNPLRRQSDLTRSQSLTSMIDAQHSWLQQTRARSMPDLMKQSSTRIEEGAELSNIHAADFDRYRGKPKLKFYKNKDIYQKFEQGAELTRAFSEKSFQDLPQVALYHDKRLRHCFLKHVACSLVSDVTECNACQKNVDATMRENLVDPVQESRN